MVLHAVNASGAGLGFIRASEVSLPGSFAPLVNAIATRVVELQSVAPPLAAMDSPATPNPPGRSDNERKMLSAMRGKEGAFLWSANALNEMALTCWIADWELGNRIRRAARAGDQRIRFIMV